MFRTIPFLGAAFFFLMGFICIATSFITLSSDSTETGVWINLGLLWCATGSTGGIMAGWLRHCMDRIAAIEDRLSSATEEAGPDDPT